MHAYQFGPGTGEIRQKDLLKEYRLFIIDDF